MVQSRKGLIVPHTPGPTSNKAISSSTLGPWEVDDLFGDTHITAMRNGMPCNVVTGMYDEENEPSLKELQANAALIAASPSLLAALKALVATVRTFRNVPKKEQEWTSLDEAALTEAFAAIEEAEQP